MTVYGVSTKAGELYTKPYGSYAGGTIVYITLAGHDLTPSNNRVNIGPYPCDIEDP